jgi:integrase
MARPGEALRCAESKGIPWVDEEPQSKHGIFDPFAVAAIRLRILIGIRSREVLNLEWRHVNFEPGALFLPDSKTGRKTVILGGRAGTLLVGLRFRASRIVLS